MVTQGTPANPSVWCRTEWHGTTQVAFFGRGAAGAADDLLPLFDPAPSAISWLRQRHSARVCEATPGLAGEGDALVTSAVRLALAVATADCVPILLSAGDRLAAVHAGWRGLESGVIAAALRALDTDASPEVWIGPAIGRCCYEVGEDVAERLRSVADPSCVSTAANGRLYADLPKIARLQLKSRGAASIHHIDLCTRCEVERLESVRRDGEAAGRNWSVIWRL